MADVMVIAIFMAYLGFNGFLKSQLETLNFKTPSLECISTSGTFASPDACCLWPSSFLGVLSFMLGKSLRPGTEPIRPLDRQDFVRTSHLCANLKSNSRSGQVVF